MVAERAKRETHESSDVRTRRVVAFGLGFVAFALVLAGGLAVFYRRITADERLGTTLADFPAPRLQPNPRQDWVTFHKAQADDLEGYGWVDRPKGLVHVPIERAMALVAARGAQGYDPVEGTAPFLPGSAPLDGAPRARPEPLAQPYGEVH